MYTQYSEIINDAINSVYHTGIANKILQYMDKIRNVSDAGQARRWVMELLQNCSDTAYEGKTVNVRITLEHDKLIFEHTGKPFRVKDILSIINQVSSKNPDENTVGRFGTGFMSTFRLSEEVTIKSVLHDKVSDGQGNMVELPYRPFEVTLDRHGRSKEEVLESIARSMRQLDNVDSNELVGEFEPDAFNTGFIYKLDNAESRSCAETGVTDLENTVKYILLFAANIESVEIINNIAGIKKIFRRGKVESVDDILEMLEVSEEGTDGADEHRIVFCKNGDITLAAACTAEKVFLPYNKFIPRVFTIFPLVGAEQFPFPVIINSFLLRPNEPRNGITLVDNAQSLDAAENKKLIRQAVKMYGEFINSAMENGFSGFENIVSIPEWHEDKEMSEAWVKHNIYNELFIEIYNCALIDTIDGRRRLAESGMHIVDGATVEEKNAVKLLTKSFKSVIVPQGEESWNEALKNYDVPEEKMITALKLCTNAKSYLKKYFVGTRDELVNWCMELCRLSAENTELATMIKAGEVAVFPSQNEDELDSYELKTILEICTDPGIPEILKDVTGQLDKLVASGSNQPLYIRSRLVHKAFVVEIMPAEYEVSKLINYISERSNRMFGVQGFNMRRNIYEAAWLEAWKLMVSCMRDKAFYDSCHEILKGELPEYTPIDDSYYANYNMWYHSIRNIFIRACKVITGCGNITMLKGYLGSESDEKAIERLNTFLTVAKNNGCQFDDSDIIVFPNLKGSFISKSSGWYERTKYMDGVEAPELYEIIEAFESLDEMYDVSSVTIDRRIDASIAGLPAMTDAMVCEKINSALIIVTSNGPLSDASDIQQQACTKLLAWIRNNSDKAGRYFPNYATEENQMKLLTPRSAVIMQRKVDKCDELLKKYNAGDMDELAEIFAKMSARERNTDESFYDDTYDVYCEGLWDMAEAERMEFCRKVGNAGEKHVFDSLVKGAEKDGFIIGEESETEVILTRTSGDAKDKVIVYRGDHNGYNQSGWDIRVTRCEDGAESVKYYEVKTHAAGSVQRDGLRLSNSQMKMAMLHSVDYYVVKVVCDKYSFVCSIEKIYDNIGRCIAEGVLSMYDGYNFTVRNI